MGNIRERVDLSDFSWGCSPPNATPYGFVIIIRGPHAAIHDRAGRLRRFGHGALALLAPETSEAGDRVGVAAAVTPQATSKPQGGSTKTLKIGKSVFYNERNTTSGSGAVQVLLIDGSTFTVGPGSNLIIDKFVYDPRTGTGELAATFSKGALRLSAASCPRPSPA